MTKRKLKVSGAWLISGAVYSDARGAFTASWEDAELKADKLLFTPDSACHSFNARTGTVRGMHYQRPPHSQSKLVSCVAGRIYDVIVDVRPESDTYLVWDAVELSERSGDVLYIPAGCAHGFMTLTDNSTVFYLIEGEYKPDVAGTIRWNDPAVGIRWPLADPILSERDQKAPDYTR